MQSYIQRTSVQVLFTLILISVVVALCAYAFHTLKLSGQGMYGPTTISVVGEGEVFAIPDIGQFSFSVQAEGDDAAEAQRLSAEAINSVISYLEGAGVDREKDISTQGYNLSPKYRFEPRVCPAGAYCPGEQILDGYEVVQTVSVKVRDLDEAGTLISGVGERGATNISSLQFTVDDDSALLAEARDIAISDAKAKAEVIADSLGVRLVKMMGFHENEKNPVMYGMGGDMAMSMARSEMAVAPDMPTGEQSIKSMVTLTYEIK